MTEEASPRINSDLIFTAKLRKRVIIQFRPFKSIQQQQLKEPNKK